MISMHKGNYYEPSTRWESVQPLQTPDRSQLSFYLSGHAGYPDTLKSTEHTISQLSYIFPWAPPTGDWDGFCLLLIYNLGPSGITHGQNRDSLTSQQKLRTSSFLRQCDSIGWIFYSLAPVVSKSELWDLPLFMKNYLMESEVSKNGVESFKKMLPVGAGAVAQQ